MYGLPDLSAVRFSTRTLIEGLIAHGKLRPGDVNTLLHALRENAVVQAFQDRILESLYSEERIRNVSAIVRGEWSARRSGELYGYEPELTPSLGKASFLRHVPPKCLDHLVMIRTVLVTPTRILIGPPQQEPSNSVTRRYSDKLDGIIRVQFADEEDALFVSGPLLRLLSLRKALIPGQVADYTKQADSLRPDVGPMARVRRALQHGIVIGGQRFLPVASSASQQK
jgi:RNA-dependent RNA polymerase